MSESHTESRLLELSVKIDALVTTYKVVMASLLVFLSFLNFAETFAIPKFWRIFRDAMPDQPLPLLTTAVLESHGILPFLAVLWPAVGLFVIFMSKQISTSVYVPVCMLIVTAVQLATTWLALFLPMISLVNGMSDSPK